MITTAKYTNTKGQKQLHIKIAYTNQHHARVDKSRLSSRTPNPSIVVRQPVGRTVRNSWTIYAHHNFATPHDTNRHSSSPPIERHRRMKSSNSIRRKDICLITSNLYRHCRRAREQRCEENLVLHNDIGTCGWLPRSVSRSAVAGARRGWGETVPEVELLFRDAWPAGFVGLDVIGKKITPVVVGHVIDVGLGSLRNPLFFDGTDIVRFAVVIPGKNLLCQFPFQFRQVKRCDEILGRSPLQIEAALAAPAASGCATNRLLATSNSCCTVAVWCRTTETLASCRPWEPRPNAKLNLIDRFCRRRPEPMRPS